MLNLPNSTTALERAYYLRCIYKARFTHGIQL